LKNRQSLLEKQKLYRQANKESFAERDRRYRRNNRRVISEKAREYRKNNKDKIRRNQRKWEMANPDRVREATRKYAEADPQRRRDIAKRWRENNWDKKLADQRKRRGMKYKKSHAPYDFKAICAQFGNRCLACGRSDVKLTVDHVLPISRGGADAPDNVQPLCQSCNSSKGVKTTDYRSKDGRE
jgi:5-methylcytosine-specific restriction endonuclease McrA